jgi:hypothetical protein
MQMTFLWNFRRDLLSDLLFFGLLGAGDVVKTPGKKKAVAYVTKYG